MSREWKVVLESASGGVVKRGTSCGVVEVEHRSPTFLYEGSVFPAIFIKHMEKEVSQFQSFVISLQ